MDICEHGRQRSDARSAVGHQSASTVVSAISARSAVGINLRARSSALSMQGVRVEQMTSVCKTNKVTVVHMPQ